MELENQDLEGILILDGGFSTQLVKYVGPNVDGDPLWSARYNATKPKDVIQTHLDYLRAGADAIITNTYQASIEGYMEHLGLTRQQSKDLMFNTAKLALRARYLYEKENPESNRRPLVMGSVGPYGAHLHDGSEYSGSYAKTITKEEIQEWHRPRIEALINAGVDGLAIETIPCQLEAEALVELIVNEYPGTKAWLSFQCQDESRLAHGELFRDAALSCWELARESQCLLAVGVNCVHPKYAVGLCKFLNRDQMPQIPLVVYPNSGENYTPTEGWKDKDRCVPVQDYVSSWLDSGATFIGGCCRTDDEDIRNIRKSVIRWINKRELN
ncbi:uncharacterized protein LOC113367465 [Ctenocephalides felis]|uniref:uncharacterized protein LOC113367465 n=1 Tax=Ctenocephalides felis TaxID=7515 RepID=UPI000E6E4B11|nr:uncharacterized protein LOC113367465 [Ctenocephalides felis]